MNNSELGKIEVKTIDGQTVTLDKYKNQVLVIVNVASKCGFTPQYEGLEKLYRKYKDKGVAILGFPCDQFGNQEPGSDADIQSFCSLTYDVTFPMFSKIEVNGDHTHPLYQFLKNEKRGILGSQAIKWNFTKFLVDKKGEVIERFAPTTKPEDLEGPIEAALSA